MSKIKREMPPIIENGRRIIAADITSDGKYDVIEEIPAIDAKGSKEILHHKPDNWTGTNDEWVAFAHALGVERMWANSFKEFISQRYELYKSGKLKDRNVRQDIPAVPAYFGEIGEALWEESTRDGQEFKTLLLKYFSGIKIELDKLGEFGLWFSGSGLDPLKIPDIIKAYYQ